MPRPLVGTTADARIWLCLDCCGIVCAFCSQLIIVYSTIVVARELWLYGSRPLWTALNCLVCAGGVASARVGGDFLGETRRASRRRTY